MTQAEVAQELEILRSRLSASEQRLADEQREKALLREISRSIDIAELLSLLGREIERLEIADGYLVNLIDESRENLICEKIHLPARFHSLEETYHKFRFPLRLTDANVECYEKQRPVLIDRLNVHQYPGTTKNRFERWKIESMALIPMLCGRSCLGTLMVLQSEGAFFQGRLPALERLITLFTEPLRNAIHHRNLREKESQADASLAAQRQFLRFIAQVNHLTSTESIYDMISREFLSRFPFDLVGVLTRQDDALVLRRLTTLDPAYGDTRQRLERYFQNVRYDLDQADGATSTVFLQNATMCFPDAAEIMELPMSVKDRGSLRTMGRARTILLVPIRRKQQPIGVLWLISLSEPVAISETDREFIELLCAFIGSAMTNAELYTTVGQQKQKIELLNRELEEKVVELRQLASRDRLTGLANFGAFDTEISRRIEEYRRDSGNHLSLAMLDIDHFKRLNDTHGHQAGNAVLQELGQRLTHAARTMDVACRYGGEEFAVILPKCDVDGARVFAERIRAMVAEAPFSIGAEAVEVTISVGCASYIADESKDLFIERADRALYRAKQNGRNRVESAGLPDALDV